jgi:hypothetical protein
VAAQIHLDDTGRDGHLRANGSNAAVAHEHRSAVDYTTRRCHDSHIGECIVNLWCRRILRVNWRNAGDKGQNGQQC